MDDNKSKLENIINVLQSNNETINCLEEALKKYEWSLELFYITLINQIIKELEEIEKNIKDKEFNYNIQTSFIFKLINVFCNVKYHNYLTQEILQIIISKANIEFILNKIININNMKIDDSFEKNIFTDFNNHIVNLLLTIMNFNDKALIDIIINHKDSTKLLNNLFNIFSENEYCRNFLYNLQRNFFKYYPNNTTYKENINFTINYLNKCLEKNIDYFFIIKEEINIILLLYKNDIEIIGDTMTILLMNIFMEFEKSENNNFEESICSLFKNSFNNIVFSKKNNSTYNYIFINFLFKIYNELINLDLKKSYTIFFSELFLSLDNQKNGINKYKWILQNTQFIKIILNSLIERKDENLLKIFLTKIMTLSAPNDEKNIEDCYIPDYDIYFLISNIKELSKGNEDIKSEESIIQLICSMIIKIININKKIVNIILMKYKINDLIISLIISNKYNNNIKDILIQLLEEILKINYNYYHIDIDLNIQNDLELNYINQKLYILSLSFENDKNILGTKIINIINNMISYLNQNNFESFFYYMEIIIKYIINKDNNETQSIDNEIISKINNIFIHASQIIIEHENNNESDDIKGIKFVEIKKRLIYDLSKAIFTLNLNNFKNKLNKNKNDKFFLKKIIINENTIFLIIKNILCGQSKREIIEYIIDNICIEKEILIKDKINNNENSLFIFKSPKLIYMIIVALHEIKDEECMLLFINKLKEAIKLFEINIKLLLNFDIISILIKNILQNENPKLIKETKDILNIMVEYLDEKSLINFISIIYIYLYNILINEKTYDCLKQEIIIDLFSILKNGISLSKKINHNSLSISNKKICNPYIYNFFYVSGLKRKNKIINYNINLKVLNDYNINDFNLCTIFNAETLSLLSFIYDKNKIIISEMINKKEKKIIKSIDNIDNYLKKDNNFHNISIIINFELLTINIKIDSNEIEDKINLSNNFSLYLFDIIIGYDKSNEENDISIIDISEIIILNYDNEIDMNTIINKKKTNGRNNLLETFICEKNNIIGEKILAEFNFKNNINFIQSKNIKNKPNYIYYYLDGKKLNNKYIGNFKYQNPFINKIVDIFMISYDYNIEEYCSLNKIFIDNKINKYIIKSFLSKKFDCSFNTYNYFFVDFLIGFLFIFEKKRKILLDKNDDNKKIDYNNFDNDNKVNIFINNFIILIFKIIFELQNKNIINYFLYENDILNIKIKHFFERNIQIINDKDFVEKLISIFKITNISDILQLENNSSEEYSLNIITKIFLDLMIFKKLKKEIQNSILLKLLSMINNITSKNNINVDRILYILLINLYNIIIFYQLSIENIENQNKTQITQMDLILQCIQIIYIIFETNYKYLILENSTYFQRITELNENIKELDSKLKDNIQSHNVSHFFKENIKVLSNNFIENNLIQNQIKKLSEFIIKLKKDDSNKKESYEFIGNSSDININNLIKNGNKIEKKNCIFCLYLNCYFKINFNFIYDSIKYDKYYNKIFRNIFLNFKEFRKFLDKENNLYAWFLSSKEGSHRIQNKFFLKENDIKTLEQVKLRGNKEVRYNSYIFNYDKNQNVQTIKKFYKLFILDKINLHSHFITQICDNNFNNDLSENIFNCIYVKRIYKTLSLFILTKEYILILINLFIDLDNRINVNKDEPDKEIIYLKKDDFISKFNNYVKKNNDKIVNELYDNNIEDNKKTKNVLPKFGLEKNYKFSIKKIYYKKISEMFKVSHLQIENAIEIMTTSGENHFLIFTCQQRDKIFKKILKKIGIDTNNDANVKKHIKTSSLFMSSKKVSKKNNSFYMKYCPINYIENDKDNLNSQNALIEIYNNNSNKKKNDKKYNKSLVEINTLVHEICDLWSKNKISNYDYLMALNCFSGRSLNDLTQYFIFPWIIKNFDHNILNWFSSSLYRDLSLPLFACEQKLSDLKSKYDLQDESDKYHSGTFYSTSAFVCYFLVRQRPFSEIHLEINGGQFDCPDRLFIGTKELSNLSEKQQELIPAIYNLAETYVNNNNFNFGKLQKNQKEVKDFELPNWAKEDPRKFTLILRKILESEKVNRKLNLWIDLVFGFKQSGIDAIKNYNIFRKACYELHFNEIEEKKINNELEGYLFEKQELGYLPKQLFKKAHKKKENYEEYKDKKDIFFDNSLKLMKLKLEKINNQHFNKNKIRFNKIKDLFIYYTTYYIEDHLNYNFKGGISSLKSMMNALNGENKSNHKNNSMKVKKKLNDSENKKNFLIILGDNNQFLGKNIFNVIKWSKKYIKIIDIKNYLYSCYYINEISNISCLTTDEKGKRIYIGFENGYIIEYKIINNPKTNKNIIYPFMYCIQMNEELLKNENILNLNSFENKEKQKINLNDYNTIVLEKIIENNFVLNNPHLNEEIYCLKLNEEYNLIIAITITNLIYIISTNNKLKLMHIIDYLYEFPLIIKDIIPLQFNGDFIIYGSFNVYLFNINGVPLCELNLLTKENNNLSKIKYVIACFIFDVTLFTAHEDGNIIIWKVKNKNLFENYKERMSYIFNNNNSKCFLSEYNYNYDLYNYENELNYFTKKNIINEYELKRKFDIVSQIKINENKITSIELMKMSKDMNYMIVLDENMNIYMLTNFDDDDFDNNNEKKYLKKKINCNWCKKIINTECFRTTHITSISDYNLNESLNEMNGNDNQNKLEDNNKEGSYLCEECKQKLTHTENYLYNY